MSIATPASAAALRSNDADGESKARLSSEFKAGRFNSGSKQMVKVIIQYKTPVHDAQEAPGERDMKARGALLHTRFSSIRATVMTVPAWMIPQIAKNSNVAYITPDRAVQMSNNNDEDADSAVSRDVAAAQYSVDGTSVGVAVIDSGVSDHVDLHNAVGTSRVVYSESFVTGDTSTADKYGHGTHVAGIIGGNGSAAKTTAGYTMAFGGIAPNANIINLRVLDATGAGTDSQTIAAINRAIALKSTYNIRVINLSLGRGIWESYTLDPLCQAAEAAWKAGIVVVVAAGNSGRDNTMGTGGYATIGAPGNDPYVLTIGATRTKFTATRVDDALASYSSKGPTLLDHIAKPDMVAPGNHIGSLRAIGSTMDMKYPQYREGSNLGGTPQYFRLSGTSMATPIVAGAVALLLQKNPALTPDQVKARLMKSAWKGFGTYSMSQDDKSNTYSNQYDAFSYGAGYLDIQSALGNTDVANGAALSPTAVYDPLTGNVYLANTSTGLLSNSVVWGSSVVWGTSAVWGNSVVWGSTVMLGNSVVWGSKSNSNSNGNNNNNDGFSVVWGSSVVWGGRATAALSADEDGDY